MNTNFRIKNFRVFDENGVETVLNPITILTGCNSSGKSTIVKAVFLLNSFLYQIKKGLVNEVDHLDLSKLKIDFNEYPNNLLGRFDKVVHSGSNSDSVSIEYSLYSKMLSCDVKVNFTFGAEKNDDLNNAYLKSICISKGDEVIYSCKKGESASLNLNVIKDDFIPFIQAEHIIHNYCGLEGAFGIESSLTEEEYQRQSNEMVNWLKSQNRTKIKDVLRHVRTSYNDKKISNICNCGLSILDWTVSNKSLFYIPVIVEHLNNVDKNHFADTIRTFHDENTKNGAKFLSERIAKDYIESSFSTFMEYFKDKEDSYLGDLKTNNSHFFHRNDFVLPSWNDYHIPQNQILFNPLDLKYVSFEQNDNNESKSSNQEEVIDKWKKQDITFELLYEIVMSWNKKFKSDISDYFEHENNDYVYNRYTHYAYKLLCAFACRLIEESIMPDWCGNMSYVSSSRTIVKRMYSLSDKDDFTTLLQHYFDNKRQHLDDQESTSIWKKDYEINSFMNRWVKRFGIGETLHLTVDEEGLGVQIRLLKSEKDNCKLLADEGYGITQLVSILLQIETAILAAKGEFIQRWFNLEKLDGYLTDKFHYEINTIAIEEPEIHLHPRLQSLLADMLVEANRLYNIHFLVETHSEYLIRKLQLLVSEGTSENHIENDQVSILYVYSKEEAKKAGEPQVKQIGICKDGYLNDSFGPGFYDEASSLSRKLMM